MATPNKEYWARRFEELNQSLLQKGEEYAAALDREYREAIKRVQTEIEGFYERFAKNNSIDIAEARKLLTSKELEEFRWTVQQYIKYGKENAIDGKWMKELENASLRYRISRLDSLQIQMRQQVEALSASRDAGMPAVLGDIYSKSYYKTIFEVQKGFRIGSTFAQLDTRTIDNVLRNPWAPDGSDFSAKIWSDRERLVSEIQSKLAQAFIRGDAPDRAIKEITERFGVAKSAAGRLVMTESAHFANEGSVAAYEELGVEEYEFIATLELHTCEICGELDGKVFKLSDKQTGVNYPVIHPWCRCTTAPYFEDNYTERFARGPDGKAYKVSGDTTYKQWRKQIEEQYGKENVDRTIKMQRNELSDKEAYKRYKAALGSKNVPGSFEKFRDIKYSDSEEWGVLKAQYRGMTYYEKAVRNEPEITEAVKNTAGKAGMKAAGLEYRIKGKDSYLRKIRSNFSPESNEYEVKDILRYTYTAGPKELSGKTLKAIDEFTENGYNTIEVKNTWLSPLNPYKGVNTTVRAPNGQKFELQYHTPESFALKDGQLHKLYEQWRIIKEKASPEAIDLMAKMQNLSSGLQKPVDIEKVR